MDLDSFLVSLCVLVDDWWRERHPSPARKKPGRPALPSNPEVITLAILAQRHTCVPTSRTCAPREPVQPQGTSPGAGGARSATGLRRADRRTFGRLPGLGHHPGAGHRAGEGFSQGGLLRAGELREERLQDRVGLRVQGGPGGRPGRRDHRFRPRPRGLRRRPTGEALVAEDLHEAYLADKGFTGVDWERHCLERYGTLVAATPYEDSRRAWPKTDRRWASFARQAPDHRGGDLPAEGLLRPGAPPGQDPRRAADASGGKGRGLNLRSTHQLRRACNSHVSYAL